MADNWCRRPSTHDTNEVRPSPVNKYQNSATIPAITNSNPRILLTTSNMSNERSSPVPEPSQPLAFEPSISNQALRELNTSAIDGAPQPEVPNEDPVDQMNLLSYQICDRIQKECLGGTTTHRQYEAYVKDYLKWWESNEFSMLQQNPARVSIPAMPITPAKVVLFLNYTLKRPKRSSEGMEIPGTAVGRATIQSTINALEWERSRNAHRYPDEADTKANLRSDNRVKQIEAAVKDNELMLSQARKATGALEETYTREQMLEISLSCLESERTLKKFATAIRDRALYLLPMCTALRGDNIRNLLLSDLFSHAINNHGVGLEKPIMCLRILCDKAKNNQSGKVEEQGAIRHRLVELCSFGAIALYFFVQFDLLKLNQQFNWTPDFSSEAQEAGYGTHGRREWWQYRVFPGDSGKTSSMSYQNHANRIHKLHETAGVTHAQRYTAAFVTRANGTNKEAAREMGWNYGDSYNSVYDRELPLQALLGAAMYNAQKPEAHFCARDFLEPPTEIMAQIFPWVEEELKALKLRKAANHQAADLALERFLELLRDMRKVLVQDLATLYAQIPSSFIYSCAPFNSPLFRQFAANALTMLEESETNARLALQNVPVNVAQTFQGAIQFLAIKQMEANKQIDMTFNKLSESLVRLQGAVDHLQMLVEPPKKRRKLNSKASLPLQANSDMTNVNPTTTLDSAQPIRSMFTAPVIPIAGSSCSSHVREETLADRPLTATPRPDNVIASLVEYSNIAPAPQQPSSSSTPLPQLGPSSRHHPPNLWESNWLELTKRYNINQLLQHTWDWEQNHLVPHYNFQKVTTFEELWKEYTEGLNGYLPFREIKERWAAGPAWHRNEHGKKNEFTRRKKTIDLIEKLGKCSNWTIQKALRFLTERYGSKVLGTFMRELNADKLKEIITESENYF